MLPLQSELAIVPKVLRIINRLNIGGPTWNAALLAKHLAPEFETLLVAGSRDISEGNSEFLVQELGVDFLEVKEMRRRIDPFYDYRAYRKIKSLIDDFKPDIVHTHAAKSGAIGRLAAINAKVPVIVHTFHGHIFHSYFNSFQTRFFLQTERYLAKRSSAIIAISEKQKEELVHQYQVCDEEKVKVIPLGFDLSKFREDMELKRTKFRKAYQISDNEIAIGIIGRLVPVKNHKLFIASAKQVLDRIKLPVRFFIVGDGSERYDLLSYCESLGLKAVFYPEQVAVAPVTFTSWRKDVDVVMAGLDLVCLSSWNEGTPVSLIEAQAAGKPIVSCSVGGIENTVLENQSALLVPPDDISAFSAAILNLLVNHDLRANMAVKGWPFVKERFHYERLTQDIKKLYKELLNY